MSDIFEYGETEIRFLSAKDKRLADVIRRVGRISRAVDPDLFSSVVRHIVGQQISARAQETVWARLRERFGGQIVPAALADASREDLRAAGMSFRKADCILDFAGKVVRGEFDIAAVAQMSDADATAALVSLRGIGVWTAEMILLFCLRRPNILSFGDFGIRRGMRMIFRHRRIGKALFEKYRRRFSPYCSTASLYFWAVSGGAVPALSDSAEKLPKTRSRDA